MAILSHLVVVIGIFISVVSSIYVDYLTTRKNGQPAQFSGSTQGGTLVWIYGNGFLRPSFQSSPSDIILNRVQFYRENESQIFDCLMYPAEITTTQLACYTPAMSEAFYQVRIFVNETLLDSSAYYRPGQTIFQSTPESTPQILSISSITGPPRRILTLTGDFKTSCYSRETPECSSESASLITRIYVGDNLCNLIDSETRTLYAPVTNTTVRCRLESDAIGLFNVTVHVTNGYGRSQVDESLVRISATGQRYTIETYPILSSVSPTNGSEVGGSQLTLNGEFFSQTDDNSTLVTVDDVPCQILRLNSTTIECQISKRIATNKTNYAGNRGCHIFIDNSFINLTNLTNGTIPMPNATTNRTWSNDASYSSTSSGRGTIWIIGYIRPALTATYKFRLQVTTNTLLYLSTDNNPNNKKLIAHYNSLTSEGIRLEKDQNYYFLCLSSKLTGAINVFIKLTIVDSSLPAWTSLSSGKEIQQIDIGRDLSDEHQRIVYSKNVSMISVEEIQEIPTLNQPFQIGFRGVYTNLLDYPSANVFAQALNDLPTIYPFRVTVQLFTSYKITFPIEMGDVPTLTIISSLFNNIQNATIVQQGISDGSKIAFHLDGFTTNYLDFSGETPLTNEILENEFQSLFAIRCPRSLIDQSADPSIVFAEDFEGSSSSYNNVNDLISYAFCGKSSITSGSLVTSNDQSAAYFCFAYRLSTSNQITMQFEVEDDSEPPIINTENIPITVQGNGQWHYKCLDLRTMLEDYSQNYWIVNSFKIKSVQLYGQDDLRIDTVTLRLSLPLGYESEGSISSRDQSSTSTCQFPFTYNGVEYHRCARGPNDFPICQIGTNSYGLCQSSSIEGVRRLFPRYQLANNRFTVEHLVDNQTIDIVYQYTDCDTGSLIQVLPPTHGTVQSISTASPRISGTYDLIHRNRTYSSIPVKISSDDFTNLLQSFDNFGYVAVTTLIDQCHKSSYRIEWMNTGPQDRLSTSNSQTSNNLSIIISSIQRGFIDYAYYDLPRPLLRTSQTSPQVTVLVNDIAAHCNGPNNSCSFRYSSGQTPKIFSIEQNQMLLTIRGDGFDSSIPRNIISIGSNGICEIISCNRTSITCRIRQSSCGQQVVDVNVLGKGFASSSGNASVNVSLTISSIEPVQGAAGGGYPLTVNGTGFSQNTKIFIDNQLCPMISLTDLSSLKCLVPLSTRSTNSAVNIVAKDGLYSSTTPISFTYTILNVPSISMINPTFVTMQNRMINISGSGFGNNSISVTVNGQSAQVVSFIPNWIQIIAPPLAPGLYPIRVNTLLGYARPIIQLEYRFYWQSIWPRIGSIHGGSRLLVGGQGFDNSTQIRFRDETNQKYACPILSFSSSEIQCKTDSFQSALVIEPTGVHPRLGTGYQWSPQYPTVEQGTRVTWRWDSSDRIRPFQYKVQQTSSSYTIDLPPNGFDSGPSSAIGEFSSVMNTLGTIYYWSPNIDPQGLNAAIRGVVYVVPAQSRQLSIEVFSNQYTAQSCVFPFIFNSVNYTSCTSDNDTQLWCSPTSIYSGQRLYCSSTNSFQNQTCSLRTLNLTLCNQTGLSTFDTTQFSATTCGLETVLSISPTVGTVGTEIIITGDRFDGNPCEYEIEIGSTYRCPITRVTSTSLICQISNSTRLFHQVSPFVVRVNRLGHGYLKSANELRFSFQTAITQITPTSGSIAGGTLVTIDGYGFQSGSTIVFIGDHDYTNFTSLTYLSIRFETSPQSNYLNMDLPVNISVNGESATVCLSSSCSFAWRSTSTPQLISVEPSEISGSTDLTISGENFQAGNNISTNGSSAQISINGYPCRITGMTDTELNCSITTLELGSHPITGTINGLGRIQSSLSLISNGAIDRISPLVSSIYGGRRLIIIGNGFAKNRSNLQVMIDQNSCSIVDNNPGEIQCIIPPQLTSSSSAIVEVTSFGQVIASTFFLNYSGDVTPIIAFMRSQSQASQIQINITGQNFVVGNTSFRVGQTSCQILSISSTSIFCTTPKSLSAGYHSIIVHVDPFGDSNANITYQQALQIDSNSPREGSFAGGLPMVINGNGFAGTNISVLICNRSCLSLEIKSNNELICVTPAILNRVTANQLCNVTMTVDGLTSSTTFTYRTNLTSNITSISPLRGGTGGGTIVTIVGRDFIISNRTSVTIGGVSCRIRSMNSTTIICSTGSTARTKLAAAVLVLIDGRGYADGSVYYQYMDLWSSRWTWDGQPPPESGSLVNIDGGNTIFLDMSTPLLKALIIDNGTLIFDDSQDLQLNVEYILIVNGGRFQIGTESQPFQHRAEINLYGDQLSTELPIYGAKVFAVREGTVDMHGKSLVRTWTQLGMTVTAGSSTIHLTNPVDWPVNSDIVISTTGNRFSQNECEQRRILNISSDGMTLTLNESLKYQHLGLSQQLNTTTIEIRAEVGLLSRNIIIQGISQTTSNSNIRACPEDFTIELAIITQCSISSFTDYFGLDQFGATLMISPNLDQSSSNQRIIFRLSNIEMFNVGQAFRTNRYPINFYQNGNMSLSYIKSCSIHSSSNQAIHIEATDSLTIDNNVIYNIMGRAILLQDGIERGHVFRNNFIVRLQSSTYPINADVSPAAFWLTNPNNVLEGNAVAGSSHSGYQYYLLSNVNGLSYQFNQNYRPDQESFGGFYNNSVHSCGTCGVQISPQYIPIQVDVNGSSHWSRAIFQRLVSWKNAKGIEYTDSRIIQIKDAIIFDNSDTGIACLSAVDYQNFDSLGQSIFYDMEYGSFVRDSLIIGDSQTSSSSVIPSNGGLIVMWDRGLLVHNVTFINFINSTIPAISTASMPNLCSGTCVGWTTKFSQISFLNVALRGQFRRSYDGVYEDTDGSLTGYNHSVVVAPDGLTHNMTSCTPTLFFQNAVRCSLDQGSWLRFEYHESTNRGWLNIYTNYNHSTAIPYGVDRYTNPNGYTSVLQTKQTYRLSFSQTNNWFNIPYRLLIYDMLSSDYLIIQHVLPRQPDGAFGKLPTSPLDPLTAGDLDWDFDINTNVFSYIIRGVSNSSKPQTRDISLWLSECPYCSFCTCPTTTTTTATTSTTSTSTSSTSTSATTATTTSATTQTTTSATTTTATTATTATAEICGSYCIRYWSRDADWSSIQVDSAWNARKPSDNQDIFVPAGISLTIDYPLPLIHTLRIAGQVVFRDGLNHTMYVDNIYLDGGELIAGSLAQPFNGQIDIFMTNSSPINMSLPDGYPSALTRGITVLGNLIMYGQPDNVIWTRLAQTARAGDTTITVRQTISWNEGDEIVITTTDTDVSHTEKHRITRILNSTTIQLANPLAYTHSVIQEGFSNGQQIDIAAAVGRLTRNIRIQSSSSLSGFNVYMTEVPSKQAFVRLSSVQFHGFGIFNDSTNEIYAGIYVNNLQTYSSSNPVVINGCAFVDGFNTAIELRSVHGLSITNNIIYRTYKSGIVFGGRNNLIEKNLITTIFWSGSGQSNDARSINTNFDAAIQSRKSISVILRDNVVAGVERVAYQIEGEACDPTIAPLGIINIYGNNEAHSVQSGVNIWPSGRCFAYDRTCVLIRGFTVYKALYHGYYIATRRNITIDSCASIENQVGIFTYIIGSAPENHRTDPNRVIIRNSIIVGAMNRDNCTDQGNLTSSNALYSIPARVMLPINRNFSVIQGRAGIMAPTIASKNSATPPGSWTEPRGYPCNNGLMFVQNTTVAYFNDVCNRHDVVFQASQINNDVQYPIRTELMSKYNVSDLNIMYNGFPNLDAIRKRSCRGMDCDGLKGVLLINPDQTLFNVSTSLISWDDAFWGVASHGVSDLQWSTQLTKYIFQERIDKARRYPFRGAGRSNSCVLETSMGMYRCSNASNYRALVVEVMDADASVTMFPVTVLSDIGSVNLISGPQTQAGSTSDPSTFTIIVQSGQNYTIFFNGAAPPKNLRFRVIDADHSFKCIIAVAYVTSPQIDVYANFNYVSPTNRDPLSPTLSLLDRPNGVIFNSSAGANYFERRYNWQYFMIDGNTLIDLKMSSKIIFAFPLPPMNLSSFYSTDIAWKLAVLFGVHPTKIRNVRIVASEDGSAKRRRRATASFSLVCDIREEPSTSSSNDNGVRAAVISNYASSIISRAHSGELYTSWQRIDVIANVTPMGAQIQEPFQETSEELQIINRIVLVTLPSGCREYTPCSIQPVIIAYDASNNTIDKLGSNDQPWQVKATLVTQPNVVLSGGIANYVNGQAQFTQLSLAGLGSYQIQFSFIRPNGMNSTFLQSANFTLRTGSIPVTSATIDGEERNHTDIVNLNEPFDIFLILVDRTNRQPLTKVQWSNWTWKGNVTLYQLPKFNRNGVLNMTGNTTVTVETTANRIRIKGISINVIGMYIVNIRLVSSNNQHSINVLSKAILVTDDSESLTATETMDLLSNITYNETSSNRITEGDLEIRRAMIYNQLINRGMPLVSSITMVDGYRTALFQVGTSADSIVQAVSSILSNPSDIPSLTTTSININGRAFYPSFSGSPNPQPGASSAGRPTDKTGLIVGLVVGLVLGIVLIAVIVLIIRARTKAARRRAIYLETAEEHNELEKMPQTPVTIYRDVSQIPIQMLGSPTTYPLAPTSPQYNRRVYRLPPLSRNADE